MRDKKKIKKCYILGQRRKKKDTNRKEEARRRLSVSNPELFQERVLERACIVANKGANRPIFEGEMPL
jgi:hypothetical protein